MQCGGLCCYDCGMVDDRALRFRQQVLPSSSVRRQPRPVSQPVEPTPPVLTPGDRLMGATFNPSQGFRWGDKPMGSAGRDALTGLNFLNPLASVTERVLAGESPRFSDFAVDAGLLAAGFIPFAGPGIRGAGQAARAGAGLTVTGTGDAGRLSALVRRLNKSDNVEDFITPSTMQSVSTRRPNDANEGLFRPGAQSFDYGNVPDAASPYTFGLVPTERLLPLREFDRMAEPAGQGVFGPDNVRKLSEHLASGGKLSDPLAVGWDPGFNWGYLAEGNHRLAAAEALGLEQLPTTVWRMPSVLKYLTDTYTPNPAGVGPRFDYGKNLPPVGRRMEIDTNQLRRDSFGDFPRTVGDYYVPPTMNPYLFPDLRP
jgi:hypothetical protein